MEAINVTHLWLLEWKAEQLSSAYMHSWKHIPKGTSVHLVSTSWINTLYPVVCEAISSNSINPLVNFSLDNSLIAEGESCPIGLKAGKEPGKDYAVVPSKVFDRVFSLFLKDRRQEIKGFVAWRGVFKPYIFTATMRVTLIRCMEERVIMEEVYVLDDETMLSFIRRFYPEWFEPQLDEIEDISWWSLHVTQDMDLLQSCLPTGECRRNPNIQKIVNFRRPLFEVINCPVVIADHRNPRVYSPSQSFKFLNGFGLENMGKTCFLNSALQCLLHVPQVVSYYLHEFQIVHQGSLGHLLRDLLEIRYTIDPEVDTEYRPEEIFELLPEVHRFGDLQEEDANELFLALLELLHRSENLVDLSSLPVPENPELRSWLEFLRGDSHIRTHIFGGLQCQKMQCSTCPKVTYRYSPFCSLPLDLPASKDLSVTMIWQTLDKPQRLIEFESRTPLEENEIVNTIRECVIKECNVENVIVGENRMMLLDNSIGLSNLVSAKQFIALELPAVETDCCIVLVDFWNATKKAGEAIGTRAIAMHRSTMLSDVVRDVVAYLIKVDSCGEKVSLYKRWMPTFSNKYDFEARRYRSYIESAHITIKASDGYFCETSVFLKQGMTTIGAVCTNSGESLPRIRFFSNQYPTSSLELLRTLVPSNSFLSLILGPKTDSDTTVTLLQLLEYTLRDKPMNEEDSVLCEGCNGRTQLITAMQIARFPTVLPIVLQRVRMLPSGLEKSHIKIQYPLEGLDLSPFEVGVACSPAVYDLLAVIHHSGRSLSGGHYVAYAKNPITGTWVKYNDTSVKEVDPLTAVQDEGAYMLFYGRKFS